MNTTIRHLVSLCVAVACGSGIALGFTRATPQETVLYSFSGSPDGFSPTGSLLSAPRGTFYGTTGFGGQKACNGSNSGCGTVFKLVKGKHGYTETILYSFAGGQDAVRPNGNLIADASGALYGTSQYGGSSAFCPDITQGTGCGTVFKLTPSGSGYVESVLYRFKGGADGAYPLDGVIADASGALYGTTWLGGSEKCRQLGLGGCGTVFKLTPSGSTYVKTTIYSFAGGNDGARPAAALLAGSGGTLYGTTEYGGGKGTVFRLTPSGSTYAETVLFRFAKSSQGARPISSLIADGAGALYGTTLSGTKAPGCHIASRVIGCGTVFKLMPSSSGYTESVLYTFQGGNDGFAPTAGVAFGKSGRLYGATFAGGSGAGTVYMLAPSSSGYQETVLARFTDNFQKNGGAFPEGVLFVDAKEHLFGAASSGGSQCVPDGGCGVIFEVKP